MLLDGKKLWSPACSQTRSPRPSPAWPRSSGGAGAHLLRPGHAADPAGGQDVAGAARRDRARHHRPGQHAALADELGRGWGRWTARSTPSASHRGLLARTTDCSPPSGTTWPRPARVRLLAQVLTKTLLPLMPDGGSVFGLDFDAALSGRPTTDGRGQGGARGHQPLPGPRRGPQGVRVNLVAAGPLRTLAARSIPTSPPWDAWTKRAPLGLDCVIRAGRPGVLWRCCPTGSPPRPRDPARRRRATRWRCRTARPRPRSTRWPRRVRRDAVMTENPVDLLPHAALPLRRRGRRLVPGGARGGPYGGPRRGVPRRHFRATRSSRA